MDISASGGGGGDAGTAAESALSAAGTLVDKHILINNDYLDLAGLLGAASHLAPAVSGLQDRDYPSTDAAVGEMSGVKRVPLPPELVDQFSTMQCNCAMGLFTRISRAWLTIDSDIFVWNYEDGSDVAFYDQLNETILCVGLVDPKPGVFKSHIRHLLVLITATDILLLGVGFSSGNAATSDGTTLSAEDSTVASLSEMHLLPEPLFALPTDNVIYMTVVGTEKGRIFLGGKDNSLTEIEYQAQDGWFTRKCRKVNHSQGLLNYVVPAWVTSIASDDDAIAQIVVDDSRHHLYTRSAKGVIMVYDLGASGDSLACAGRLAEAAVAQSATINARTDRSNFRDIVHIAAISREDSVDAHLVAVTAAGARLFFSTTTHLGVAGSTTTKPRPSGLHLIAVRLPPGFTPSAAVPRRPANIHAAHSRRGTVLMAQAQNDENDLLWILSSDAFAFEKKLMETQSTAGVEGRIWALDEIPTPPLPSTPASATVSTKSITPPLAVTQHMEPPRSFVIVNAQGTHMMTKLRPVDQLRELLLKAGSAQSVLVKRFFQLNSPNQACATALMLACSKAAVDIHVAALAADAFFLYGGETSIAPSAAAAATIGPATVPMTPAPGANVTVFNPGIASTPAPGFIQPTLQPQSYVAVFSHRHAGLCLYLARLVGPFWNAPVVKEVAQSGGKAAITPSFAVEDLAWFLDHLSGLRSFLDANASLGGNSPASGDTSLLQDTAGDGSLLFAHGASASNALLSSQKRALTEAALAEKTSLEGIRLAVIATCEALALWQLLAENQLHVLSAGLPADVVGQLKALTFKTLITTLAGRQVATALIARLVALYLDDNATTDAISIKLRSLCPSLYSADDAVSSKANELVYASKSLSGKQDREKTLREALILFKSIAGTPSFDLYQVASQFAGVKFYEGIVDLCLAAADRLDPQNLATHALRNDAASATHPAVVVRNNCYDVVRSVLSTLLSARDAASGSTAAAASTPSIPASPGPPSPPPPPPSMSVEEAEAAIETILNVVFRTDEELLHIEMFEWLFSNNMQDRLLQIQSPYLESWLRRCMSRDPNNLAFMNVLWKHYEKMRQFGAAAQILTKLAERSGSQLNLANRMEYLSRAAMAAKSGGGGGGVGEPEFLRELEEKIEVARLQLKILEALQNLPSTNETKEAVVKLGADLIDISTLYGDYADRFHLADCKLAIIQCAGHYDPKLVESIWVEIFESAMRSASSGEVGDVVSLVQSKLRTLGAEYVGVERYFPVEFLIRYLESLSSRLHASPRWVFATLLEINIPITAIYPIYHSLFREKDPGISVVHLLSALHQILRIFASDPGTVGPPSSEARRSFRANAANAIPGYLVALEAMTNQTQEVIKTTDDFRTLLGQIDKLV